MHCLPPVVSSNDCYGSHDSGYDGRDESWRKGDQCCHARVQTKVPGKVQPTGTGHIEHLKGNIMQRLDGGVDQ